MRFIYTRHARLRMRQRNLPQRLVEQTTRWPDRAALTFGRRMTARKRFGNKTLEVVYKRLDESAVVITAYWLKDGA